LPRIQRVFFVTSDCCDTQYLTSLHRDLIIAKVDDRAGAELIGHFPNNKQHADETARGRIYIVDPLGNLMMSYEPDAKPKGLLEDLQKLLKLSHIG
jgi:hypothetical protein